MTKTKKIGSVMMKNSGTMRKFKKNQISGPGYLSVKLNSNKSPAQAGLLLCIKKKPTQRAGFEIFCKKRLTFRELVARLKKRSGGAFFSVDPQQAMLARTPQCADKKRTPPKGEVLKMFRITINVWRTEVHDVLF